MDIIAIQLSVNAIKRKSRSRRLFPSIRFTSTVLIKYPNQSLGWTLRARLAQAVLGPVVARHVQGGWYAVITKVYFNNKNETSPNLKCQ